MNHPTKPNDYQTIAISGRFRLEDGLQVVFECEHGDCHVRVMGVPDPTCPDELRIAARAWLQAHHPGVLQALDLVSLVRAEEGEGR